ncbi:chemotaxis protein CheW [Vreelandella sp. EE22]
MTQPSPPSLEQALARQREAQKHIELDEPTRQLVLFRLEGQRFALPGSAVSEILSGDQSVYFVPGLPATIEGVIHLRGVIESVITIRSLLGLPPNERAGMILLVHAGAMRTGIRIDQLDDVCEVNISALKPPPDTLAHTLRPFVSALIQSGEHETTTVLDAEAMLTAFQAGQG